MGAEVGIFFAMLCFVAAGIALSGIRVAQEYQRAVTFRLGRFIGIRGPGLYYNTPFLEWQRLLDMRTVTVDVEPQETITKDSVTVKVNAVFWYRVMDPTKAILEVADYHNAVCQIALTHLRNVVGQHDLDEVLKERDKINQILLKIVDRDTDAWGIKVEMVEMKDVEIPQAMQRAMAREAEAMREKRARIIKAEAELESSEKLTEASRKIAENPFALELRRMQMISEVGAEQNTTTLIMMPSDFVTLAGTLSDSLKKGSLPSFSPGGNGATVPSGFSR